MKKLMNDKLSFLHRKHTANQYSSMTDDVNIQQAYGYKEKHHWNVLYIDPSETLRYS